MKSGLIFIYLYYQPNVILQFIGVASCRWVSGNKYIIAQMDRECDETWDYWNLTFVFPILIIFTLLVPILIYYGMRRKRTKLNQSSTLLSYGLLYSEVFN
jgi:hypothetical protein